MRIKCEGKLIATEPENRLTLKEYTFAPARRAVYSVRKGIKFLYMGCDYDKAAQIYNKATS